jgi:uncharacterized damage-inducible protein DinB
MNASDILKYGHLWVLKHVQTLPDEDWYTEGVCGWWSTKNIISHLASFEHVLVDILSACLGEENTPVLDQFKSLDGDKFNDVQVSQRKNLSAREALDDYQTVQAKTMTLVEMIPDEVLREPGTLPWYGMEYALDDFIVYTFYGHKREHCAQIAVFRDKIKR